MNERVEAETKISLSGVPILGRRGVKRVDTINWHRISLHLPKLYRGNSDYRRSPRPRRVNTSVRGAYSLYGKCARRWSTIVSISRVTRRYFRNRFHRLNPLDARVRIRLSFYAPEHISKSLKTIVFSNKFFDLL